MTAPRPLTPLLLTLLASLAACDATSTTPKPAPAPVAQAPAPAPAPTPAPTTPAEPVKKPLPTTAADWTGGASAAPARLDVGSVSFAVPTGWLPRPPSSSMRLAEVVIPAVAPAQPSSTPAYAPETDALVAFFRLGGTVEDNIARWAASVTGPDGKQATPQVTVREVAGLKVHDVRLDGTYLDGMPGGQRTSREGWGFRAAIIETGMPMTFVRLTGPKALVESSASAWEEMLSGMKTK